MAATRFLVLLRGVNVGGRVLAMAALRGALRAEGFADAETLIQSGNVLLTAAGCGAGVEAAVEAVLAATFGLTVPAIAREAAAFARIAAAAPFPDAARPHLHLVLAKRPIAADAPARLAERARAGERCALVGDALWIDYAAGAGRSKLAPALVDRACGSPATARNANTVAKLATLLAS